MSGHTVSRGALWSVMLALSCVWSSPLGMEVPRVTVRGHLVCASPTVERDGACPRGRVGIRTAEGRMYLFLPEDPAAALLADSSLRSEELQIIALRHGEQKLQSVRVRVIRGGRLYDISYVCDVCHIRTPVPGPCPCCQKELVRQETLAEAGEQKEARR